jgi:hypothetical protein
MGLLLLARGRALAAMTVLVLFASTARAADFSGNEQTFLPAHNQGTAAFKRGEEARQAQVARD